MCSSTSCMYSMTRNVSSSSGWARNASRSRSSQRSRSVRRLVVVDVEPHDRWFALAPTPDCRRDSGCPPASAPEYLAPPEYAGPTRPSPRTRMQRGTRVGHPLAEVGAAPRSGTPAGSIVRRAADLHAGAHGNALPTPHRAEALPTWAAPVAARRPHRGRRQGLRQGRHRGPRPRRRDRRPPRRPLHRHHGPVGLRQEHADALPRRPRHAVVRPGLPRRHRARLALRPRAHPRPARAHRLRVPGLQPAADARRLREHHAADGARRPPAEQGVGAHDRRDRRPRPTA